MDQDKRSQKNYPVLIAHLIQTLNMHTQMITQNQQMWKYAEKYPAIDANVAGRYVRNANQRMSIKL